MKIIEEGRTYRNIKIQIEDWSGASDKFPKDSTVVCYPYSRETVNGVFKTPLIKRFHHFRYELQFKNAQKAKKAFDELVVGDVELIDYIDNYKGIFTKEIVTKCLGYDDEKIERLWDELKDVPFYENEEGCMCLDTDWQGFDKGTDRETIWYWFDEHHTKGIYWLMYEYEPEF